MDAPPPLRQPRAPVVPTGIPHGVDAVVGAIRSGRPTRQVPQRSGHAPQPPRCSTGGGTPQAGRVDAQRPLVGLIEGVRRPPWPIQATARVGAPVHAMGDPHDRASRPRLGVTTHDEAHRTTSAARDQASTPTTPQGDLAPDGRFDSRHGQGHGGPTRRMPCLELRVLAPPGIDLLRPTMPGLGLGGRVSAGPGVATSAAHGVRSSARRERPRPQGTRPGPLTEPPVTGFGARGEGPALG